MREEEIEKKRSRPEAERRAGPWEWRWLWVALLLACASLGTASQFDSPDRRFSVQGILDGVKADSPWAAPSPVAVAPAKTSEDFDSAAVENAQQATVAVLESLPEDPSGLQDQYPDKYRGTGFHIGDGYIVTALHVAARQYKGSENYLPPAIFIFTRRQYELTADLVGADPTLDLALYRVPQAKRSSLSASVNFSGDPLVAEPVFTVGFPGGRPATTFGRVGATNSYLRTSRVRMIQVNLHVCGGNSGGALFDSNGDVVGMMQSIITESREFDAVCGDAHAFAVPASLLRKGVAALESGGHVRFSRVGLEMDSVKVGDQWRVSARRVSGPALAAGLKAGDVLISVDGVDITDAAQFKSYIIAETEPGKQIILRARRGDQIISAFVTLGALDP